MSVQGYLTMSQLRDRGWNDRMVRHYLGDADDTYLRPGPRPGRPQRLYLLNRVVAVETLRPEFNQDQVRKAELAERTRRSAEVKMRQFQYEIEAIELPQFSEQYAEITAKSRERWPALAGRIPEDRLALTLLLDSLQPVLDNALSLYTWHPGIREARLMLKQRVLAHVVKHYPALAAVAQAELSDSDRGRETP